MDVFNTSIVYHVDGKKTPRQRECGGVKRQQNAYEHVGNLLAFDIEVTDTPDNIPQYSL